jgi:deazaflavin-dependent oxidoreductase (nitroreductase family)
MRAGTAEEWVGAHAGDSFCYVTTRGRRTGRAHTIEIWFAAEGRRLYLLAELGRRADWIRNLLAEPAVSVRLGDRTRPARAGLVTDPDADHRIRRLLAAKYQDWREPLPLSEWAATALLVAIEVDPVPPAPDGAPDLC